MQPPDRDPEADDTRGDAIAPATVAPADTDVVAESMPGGVMAGDAAATAGASSTTATITDPGSACGVIPGGDRDVAGESLLDFVRARVPGAIRKRWPVALVMIVLGRIALSLLGVGGPSLPVVVAAVVLAAVAVCGSWLALAQVARQRRWEQPMAPTLPAPAVPGETLAVVAAMWDSATAGVRRWWRDVAGVAAVLLAATGAWWLRQPSGGATGCVVLGAATVAWWLGGRAFGAGLRWPAPAAWSPWVTPLRAWSGRRRVGLVTAVTLSLLTFALTGHNTLSTSGMLAWAASVALWLAVLSDGGRMRFQRWRARLGEAVAAPSWNVAISRAALLLVLALTIGVAFRTAHLADVPSEMTSDHVEKLLDAREIAAGRRPVFEPGIGGREVLPFYLVALTATVGGTGWSHLTLKLVMVSAGLLALAMLFPFARGVTGDAGVAVLAVLLCGIAWWPNSIARNGLRFPFAPLFATVALWLLWRSLQRGCRNDALAAGLAFGIGLYGYTAVRGAALAMVAMAVIAALAASRHPKRSKRFQFLARVATMVALALAVVAAVAGGATGNGIMAMALIAGFVAVVGLVAGVLRAGVRGEVVRGAATHLLLAGVIAAAVAMPLARYAFDEPHTFWSRSTTRILGDPNAPGPRPSPAVALANARQAFGMFFATWDQAWLVSPAGEPALDPITAGLFWLGLVHLVLARSRRSWVRWWLLAALPLLLLPSALALAFPGEVPSLHRASAIIPLVFTIAAVPLAAMLRRARAWPRWARAAAGTGLVALLAGTAQANWRTMFVAYPATYDSSAENASEIGGLIRAFAMSVGSWDSAWVVAHPYWVDMRAVAFCAGRPDWDHVLREPFDIESTLAGDRSKLFVLNKDADPLVLAELRRLYPNGESWLHPSALPNHEFRVFVVPARPGERR